LSHIVTIKTQVKDAAAIQAACQRLQLEPPQAGTVRLFSGEASGLAIQFPGWKYPVVCDVQQGELRYDNFEERWGERRQLDAFLQAYAVERAKLEARKQGHSTTEQLLADGSIKLTIEVGGAA
jgi:hypothetical protein